MKWIIASLLLATSCIAQQPVMAVYDVSQIPQAKEVALSRRQKGKSPLVAILNVNSGPGTVSMRRKLLEWQPANSVISAGYVDLDDSSGRVRKPDAIKADVQIWKNAGVQMIFLDDAHAWDDSKRANALRSTVEYASKGFPPSKIIINAGEVIGKSSQWMRTGYIVCDFEDPINYLKSENKGQMWLAFVSGGDSASYLLGVAKKRGVRFVGFDLLANWKTPRKEWQTPLPQSIITLLKSL